MNDLLSVAVNAHGGLSWWHQLKTVKARLEQRATVTPLERILVTLHIISKAIALKLVPTNALVLTDQANFPESATRTLSPNCSSGF